jgi:hypothetical protein
LVLHQRDEGRHDHAEAAEHQGRNLETDRLASAGGQHGQGISAIEDGLQDRDLGRPEIGIAEMVQQQTTGFGHGIDHVRRCVSSAS